MNKVEKCLLQLRKTLKEQEVTFTVSKEEMSNQDGLGWFEILYPYNDYPDADALERIARSFGLNSRYRIVGGMMTFACDDFPF